MRGRSAWREKLTSPRPARVNHVWEITPTFTVTVRGAVAQLNDLALFVTGIGPGSSLSAEVARVQDDLAKGKSPCAGPEKVIDEAVKEPGRQAHRCASIERDRLRPTDQKRARMLIGRSPDQRFEVVASLTVSARSN